MIRGLATLHGEKIGHSSSLAGLPPADYASWSSAPLAIATSWSPPRGWRDGPLVGQPLTPYPSPAGAITPFVAAPARRARRLLSQPKVGELPLRIVASDIGPLDLP